MPITLSISLVLKEIVSLNVSSLTYQKLQYIKAVSVVVNLAQTGD